MDQKYHINYFIEPIYNRKHKRFSLLEWFKLRKFLKQLRKTSPNFNMLLEIYHFIRLLSNVYFYNNSEKNEDATIFTIDKSTGSSTPDASFCIRRGSICVTYRLWIDEQWIEVIKSNDFKDTKSPAIRFKFRDGESVIENIDEENMFLGIISITMDTVSDIVEYYWKHKFKLY